MVQFSKLRVTGFKSFADTTEIDIMPGLNGIVGPNGCGKSNLVEAMRWMMGETSAKSLRGGEMDDVIFAGTGKRPSRNFAEVVLTLKNPDKTAPEPFRDMDTIEVSRRIDRGMGSDYRINGKIVRAADVQLLFADSSTGAHSPAIVSQGRVTALIQAKPVDRRRVLEDAAAISGLHNRRREAEIKLRAAEKNLTRVDDMLGQKSGTYEQLVKQAKQAERYKTLSETIRRLEALSLAMEWTRITQEIEAAQASMLVANEAQNQAKQSMYDLSKTRDALHARMDAVERQIAEQQQKIQSVQRDKDRAVEELQRYEQTKGDLQHQQQSLEQDQAYERESFAAANEKLAALMAEKEALQTRLNNFSAEVQTAQTTRDQSREAFEKAQAELQAARAEQATLNAQRQMYHQQMQRNTAEAQSLEGERNAAAQTVERLSAEMKASEVSAMQQRLQQNENAAQTGMESVATLEKQAEALNVSARAAVDALQAAQAALNHIDMEIKALSRLAETNAATQEFESVLDKVTVTSGYEQALSVAMGRELRAGLDDSAPIYWQMRSDTVVADLPHGSTSLYKLVKAPEAMQLALSMVGVVDDKAAGERLLPELSIGQMLVSRDGYGWRWDGFTVTPNAAASAQERETKQLLEQRNRLVVLRQDRVGAESTVENAQKHTDTLNAEQNALRTQITAARESLSQLQRQVTQERATLSASERAQADLQARHFAATEKQTYLAQRLEQNAASAAQVKDSLDAMPPEEQGRARVETLQNNANEAEEAYRAKDQNFMGLHTQQTQMQHRLDMITREESENSARASNATQRQSNLAERLQKVNDALAQLKSPDHVQEQMAQADAALKEMDAALFALQTQRTETVTARNALDAQNQQQQEALMGAREALARSETQFANGQQMLEQVIERCDQNMGCAPEAIAEQFEFDEEDLGQNAQMIRGKQDRARGERDRIGAVNLRADEEATVLGEEIAKLTAEKDDILQAIEKLRHGIATLNRDARKKMLAAFEEVNTRFKEVFTRLFNGGEAYLQLVDAEDPLDAGLEIFAQPPGKKLQTLTLLSGGEQSLTAIALIFAMFLTQPSPICVLDEIDAALDDANVERICNLLKDFARTHPTRFLVITHNAITMSSLHRLYGVTMMEKGVSKLVSVDLERHQREHAEGPMAIAAE